jgi:hypothetical protein
MKRATQRFLEGTKHRSPVEAVEAGLRTLGQWADILAEERELESQMHRERDGRRERVSHQADVTF